jgi:hypothetical protein
MPKSERESFILSQFSSVTVIPVAMPANPVCTPALYADLQTSLLLITTEGADAVGGALSVTTVDDTVFVSAVTIEEEQRATKSTVKNVLMFLIVSPVLLFSVFV